MTNSDAIRELTEKENLKKLKSSVSTAMEAAQGDYLNNMKLNLEEEIKNNQQFINPEKNNQNEEVKKKNKWENTVQKLSNHKFENIKQKISNVNSRTGITEGFETETGILLREGFNQEDRQLLDNFTLEALKRRRDFFGGNNGCINNVNEVKAEYLAERRVLFNEKLKKIKTHLISHESLLQYYNTGQILINKKKKNLDDIESKIEKYKNNLFIDSRKSNYENKNYEFYKNVHFFLIILYYSLFALFLIFSNFFQEKQYYNKKIVCYLILYLIFPIVLPYFLVYLKYLYVYYLELNNEREEIVSYEDIVNKKNQGIP